MKTTWPLCMRRRFRLALNRSSVSAPPPRDPRRRSCVRRGGHDGAAARAASARHHFDLPERREPPYCFRMVLSRGPGKFFLFVSGGAYMYACAPPLRHAPLLMP